MRAALSFALVLCVTAVAAAAEPAADGADAWWQRVRVRGRVAEEVAYRLHDPGDVSKLRTVGWLDGKLPFTEAVSLRVATRAWYDAVFDATDRYPANVERDQKTELSLREALLSVSHEGLDVRAGRQQIVWGEAISTFVTDVVNPRDFREFIFQDFTELRLPLWALDGSYRLAEGVTLEGVWTPDTLSDKLPKQGAEFQFARPDYHFRAPVIRLPDGHDQFSLARSAGGFRLSALRDGWDVSLIYWDADDRTPVLFQRRIPQPAGPDVIALEPRHPRVRVAGATVGKSLDPVVLRGEIAVSVGKRYETTDPSDRDGVVRRDTIDYLVGVDYTFFEQVDAALQVSQKILTGPAAHLTRGGVEAQVSTSVAVRLTTGFFDNTLNPTVLGVVDVDRADFRLSPRIEWLTSSAVTVVVGADILEGPRRTLYGQFDKNDRVYVTTTWKF